MEPGVTGVPEAPVDKIRASALGAVDRIQERLNSLSGYK